MESVTLVQGDSAEGLTPGKGQAGGISCENDLGNKVPISTGHLYSLGMLPSALMEKSHEPMNEPNRGV